MITPEDSRIEEGVANEEQHQTISEANKDVVSQNCFQKNKKLLISLIALVMIAGIAVGIAFAVTGSSSRATDPSTAPDIPDDTPAPPSFPHEWSTMHAWPWEFGPAAGSSNKPSKSKCKDYCSSVNAKYGAYWTSNYNGKNCRCYKSLSKFCPSTPNWRSGGTFFAETRPYCV